MSSPVIEVRNLSKAYRLGVINRKTLQDELYYWWLRLRGREPFEHMGSVRNSGVSSPAKDARKHIAIDLAAKGEALFWALKNVSFDVQPGEIVGIIGRNGAGKSTLLKILSRITEPTTGEAMLEGRWGSLLEVGTGFHPDLTGRENVYMNGTILGMKKFEIDRKFDEIVAFSEIEKFIDTPVKRYSSGMMVRLAFAVAAHLETEILIMDEVLAVGDAQFQKKCMGKMGSVAREGRTVLFVSHQMNAVRALCTRCIWLRDGEMVDDGKPEEVVGRYMNFGTFGSEWTSPAEEAKNSNPYFGATRLAIVDGRGDLLRRDLRVDEPFGIVLEGVSQNPHESLVVGFQVSNFAGDILCTALHKDDAEARWPAIRPGSNRLIAQMPAHFLNEGSYRVELMVALNRIQSISQPGKNAPAVKLDVRGGFSPSPHWIRARPGIAAPMIEFRAG